MPLLITSNMGVKERVHQSDGVQVIMPRGKRSKREKGTCHNSKHFLIAKSSIHQTWPKMIYHLAFLNIIFITRYNYTLFSASNTCVWAHNTLN